MLELQAEFNEVAKMRMDFDLASQAVQEPGRNPQRSTASSASRTPAQAAAVPPGEEQAQVSGWHIQVQALTAQASQLPEIRQARVESLRQAVLGGQYHPESEQIAQALVEHMVVDHPIVRDAA